jgi:hypothetical protein
LKLKLHASLIAATVTISITILLGFAQLDRGFAIEEDEINSEQGVASEIGVLTFTKITADTDGTRYLLGEVNNQNAVNSIDAIIYFSKAGPGSAYYSDYIGLVSPGMGMPFKIPLNNANSSSITLSNESDIKVKSFATLNKPMEALSVDYTSLVMNQSTHAISGMLDNKSPKDVFGTKVLAIAMDLHSQILDVVQSKPIEKIHANGSSLFTLVPMSSIANRVALYSCFVTAQGGQNVTLPAENDQNLQLEIYGDSKIKNLKYDSAEHILSFDAQGIFPGGGWATLMITSGPASIMNSNLIIYLNGQNATKSLVSSEEISPSKFYKHVEVAVPFGRNSIVISALSTTPEFPYPIFTMIIAAGSLLLVGRWAKLYTSGEI